MFGHAMAPSDTALTRASRRLRVRTSVGVGLAVLMMSVAGSCGRESRRTSCGCEIHAFYYPWYGTPEVDGEWVHWTHPVENPEPNAPAVLEAPDDIGANFYPSPGLYSINDPNVVARHMRQMRDAGIDVLVASWWGPGGFEDRTIPLLLDQAQAYGLSVAFHIEPSWTGAGEFREWLEYIVDSYGGHPAFYRRADSGLPMFYVFLSFLELTPAEWASLLTPTGADTLRGTAYDGVFVGHQVFSGPGGINGLADGGFDAVYPYLVSPGFQTVPEAFTAAMPENWPAMAAHADSVSLSFIPCVGPGYADSRIRPTNVAAQRDREGFGYYDRMFEAAVELTPPIIAITSFNEWHEGTQIEPAMPFTGPSFVFEDYGDLGPEAYLDRTATWAAAYRTRCCAEPISAVSADSRALSVRKGDAPDMTGISRIRSPDYSWAFVTKPP